MQIASQITKLKIEFLRGSENISSETFSNHFCSLLVLFFVPIINLEFSRFQMISALLWKFYFPIIYQLLSESLLTFTIVNEISSKFTKMCMVLVSHFVITTIFFIFCWHEKSIFSSHVRIVTMQYKNERLTFLVKSLLKMVFGSQMKSCEQPKFPLCNFPPIKLWNALSTRW